MTRYKFFYTDGLKAAWMAKHFEMNFPYKREHHHFSEGKFYAPITLASYGAKKKLKNDEVKKYYIDLGSYKILEPQVGDFCTYQWRDETCIGQIQAIYSQDIDCILFSFGATNVRKEAIKIIRRNGEAFFMPEYQQ